MSLSRSGAAMELEVDSRLTRHEKDPLSLEPY